MGIGIGISGAAVVIFVVLAFIIVSAKSEGSSQPPTNAEIRTCFTKCAWFTEKNCENGAVQGACFFPRECDKQLGRHPCEQ